jgi:hypothetical protein
MAADIEVIWVKREQEYFCERGWTQPKSAERAGAGNYGRCAPSRRIIATVIHDAATYPGLILRCKPIGVLEVLQTSKGGKERTDRIFAEPDGSPFEGDLQDVRHLPARAVEELEKFFEASDALGDKKPEFLGWRGPTRANKKIKRLSL